MHKNNMHKRNKKISEHFSQKDFSCKCGKCDTEIKISLGLIGGLELLRSKCRKHINILKGYTCPEYSITKKDFRKNYHSLGIAADITIDNLNLKEAFKLAETIPEFKGIGLNLSEKHIHIDTRKEKNKTSWITQNGKILELNEKNLNQYLE